MNAIPSPAHAGAVQTLEAWSFGPAPRRDTRQVRVGGVAIGGGAPVVVQSMTNTDTADVAGTGAKGEFYVDSYDESAEVAGIVEFSAELEGSPNSGASAVWG